MQLPPSGIDQSSLIMVAVCYQNAGKTIPNWLVCAKHLAYPYVMLTYLKESPDPTHAAPHSHGKHSCVLLMGTMCTYIHYVWLGPSRSIAAISSSPVAATVKSNFCPIFGDFLKTKILFSIH